MTGRTLGYPRRCDAFLCLLLLTTGPEGVGSESDELHVPTWDLAIATTVSNHNCSRSFLSVGFPHFFYKWGKFQLRSPKAIALAKALPETIIRIYGTPLFTEDDIEAYRLEHRPEPSDEDEEYDEEKEDEVVPKEEPPPQAEVTQLSEDPAGEDEVVTKEEPPPQAEVTQLSEDPAGEDSEDAGLEAEFVNHDPYLLRLTRELWVDVVRFARAVNWRFMFGFTTFSHKNGFWNTRYARTFLEMAQKEKILIREFQLGNEPNLYKKSFKINATQVAKDFSLFVRLLQEYPAYRESKIIGPDVTQVTTSKKFFELFLQSSGCDYVDEFSFHHYYYKKDKSLEMFKSIAPLKEFVETMKRTVELLTKYNCTKPMRITETSNAVGGGAPHLSNAFVAGFSWMDKLGQSALHQITRVFRHTFFGGNYALVEPNMKPNPDYYLSLMFKRFVEGPVFKVIRRKLPAHIRAYANCAREYSPGSLIVYLMNLGVNKEYVNFTQYFTETLSVYRFTPHGGNLKARRVLLNGEELIMNGNTVPLMKASRELGNAVFLPSYSYAFVVISRARINACINYFKQASAELAPTSPDGFPVHDPQDVPRDIAPYRVRGDPIIILYAQVVTYILRGWLDVFIDPTQTGRAPLDVTTHKSLS